MLSSHMPECCLSAKMSKSWFGQSSEDDNSGPLHFVENFLKNYTNLLIFATLTIAAIFSALVRMQSVMRFESIIHEADPWFNFRAARYLSENGYEAYKNWFDEKSWYPSGRFVYYSAYHGMMITSNVFHKIALKFSPDVSIKDICVFNGVIFSFFTVYVTYLINYEIFNKSSGILAALLVAFIPSLVARTHAGSYDYESMAIFQIQLIIYFWIKAFKNGSMLYGSLAGIAYFYLNSTWGGVIFVANLISLHAFATALVGQGGQKLLQSFVSFVVIQNLLSYHVPFSSHTHISSLDAASPLFVLAFLVCQSIISDFVNYLSKQNKLQAITATFLYAVAGAFVLFFTVFMIATNKIHHFSGRVLNLFDPDHFRNNDPLVTSVAEHSGTKWASLFVLNGILMFIAPLGTFLAFVKGDTTSWILIINYITLSFFTTRMNRLKLLLAPALSLIGGFTIAEIFFLSNRKLKSALKHFDWTSMLLPVSVSSAAKVQKPLKRPSTSKDKLDFFNQPGNILNIIATLFIMHALFHFVRINLSSFNYNGLTNYIRVEGGYSVNDDVKDAYSWIASNTPSTTRILSWWDYGYQLTGFTNRTVFVDNFTVDSFRIAIVGLIMSGNEDLALKYMRMLKVNYLLVFTPGLSRHGMGDDLSKFYWMVRISQNAFSDIVDESLYGQLNVHKGATKTMVDSIMYKTCFFDHEKQQTDDTGRMGVNPNSGQQIFTALNGEGVQLKYLEEAYSSTHRTIRIYKLKDPSNYWMENKESEM